jgi:putative endonuclease
MTVKNRPYSSHVHDMQPNVYILASKRNGTLYIGVTSDLLKRVSEHRSGVVPGRYGVRLLVYFEPHASMDRAIRREKQMKDWRRSWKLRLIEERNPQWRDLFDELI